MTLQQAQELLRPANHGGLLALMGAWHSDLSWVDDNFENMEQLVTAYESYIGEKLSTESRQILISECQSYFFMIWQ